MHLEVHLKTHLEVYLNAYLSLVPNAYNNKYKRYHMACLKCIPVAKECLYTTYIRSFYGD